MTEKSDDDLFERDAAKISLISINMEFHFRRRQVFSRIRTDLNSLTETIRQERRRDTSPLADFRKNGHRIGCFHRQTMLYKDNIRKICIKKGGKAFL